MRIPENALELVSEFMGKAEKALRSRASSDGDPVNQKVLNRFLEDAHRFLARWCNVPPDVFVYSIEKGNVSHLGLDLSAPAVQMRRHAEAKGLMFSYGESDKPGQQARLSIPQELRQVLYHIYEIDEHKQLAFMAYEELEHCIRWLDHLTSSIRSRLGEEDHVVEASQDHSEARCNREEPAPGAEPGTMITHDHGMKIDMGNHEQLIMKKQASQHKGELPKVKEGKEIHAAITPIYSLRSPKSFSDIKLRPLEDDDNVRVYTPGQTEGRNVSYAEFGMAHKETGKPIDLWVLFVNCIENNGKLPQLPSGSKKERNQLKSVKRRIKEKLCAAFGTDEDPFYLLADGVGYRLKCRIEEERHSDRLKLESELNADIEAIDGKQNLPYGLPKNTRHRENDE